MAKKPDARYVQIYNPGSTAKKLDFPPRKEKFRLPKPKVHKEHRKVIYVDPLALCATAAAGILLIAMVAGMIRLGDTGSRMESLESSVSVLQQENVQLRQEFEGIYDPVAVEYQAREDGMISSEEAQHVSMELTVPQPQKELSFWERTRLFFSELFA